MSASLSPRKHSQLSRSVIENMGGFCLFTWLEMQVVTTDITMLGGVSYKHGFINAVDYGWRCQWRYSIFDSQGSHWVSAFRSKSSGSTWTSTLRVKNELVLFVGCIDSNSVPAPRWVRDDRMHINQACQPWRVGNHMRQ